MSYDLTTWPSVQVPVPPIAQYPVVRSGDWLLFDESAAWDGDEPCTRELPEGFCYRELAKVDLTSPDALEAFAMRYGAIPLSACFPLDSIEGSQIASSAHWLSQRLRETASWPPDSEYKEGEAPSDYLPDELPVGEYAAVLGILRDTSRVIAANRNPELLPEAALLEQWESSAMYTPQSLHDAVEFAVQVLNSGLRSFSVRVVAKEGLDLYGEHLLTRLFPAACLQMANYVCAGASFSRCDNATCGATFVHRAGKVNWKHRRSDSIYCSARCTNQEMQRRRRALRADVTRLMKEGLSAAQIAERLGQPGKPLRVATVETLMREVLGRRKGGNR